MAVFPESNDFSVIPTNWLVDQEKLAEGAIKFCRWPLNRVTSNELKAATDPEPSWETYRVKVVGRSKTYGKNFRWLVIYCITYKYLLLIALLLKIIHTIISY